MIIVGICGRSGSGKSTVGKIIKNKYPAYIDCDNVSREITKKNSPCLLELVDYFGNEILFSDGNLNRAKLASIAFGNEEKLAVLNRITHKYITEDIETRILNYKNDFERFVFLDAPTLFESGIHKRCDFILSVIADDTVLLERIKKRDKKSDEDAKKRLSSQYSNDFLIRNSDFVIENNGTLEQLEEKTENFLKTLEETYE